jgi:replicative DNA helicase
MNNSEMNLVAELLKNPSLITSVDVDSEWFDSKYLQTVVEAISKLKGRRYTLEHVYRELRTIDLFNAGSVEDLEMLESNAKQLGIEHELARQVHSDYIERKLVKASQEFADTLSKTSGDKLQRLLEEKQEVNHIKADGRLEQSFNEFCENLEKPNEALTSYGPIDNFLGGGITGGKLIVLAGRPATGKTAFALNIMMQLFEKNENVTCDFFTFEMGQNELMTRLISRDTRINSLLFVNKNVLSQENKIKARQSYEKIKNTNDLRVYTSEYTGLNDIKSAVKRRARKNRYIAFVDYAGLITVNDSRKNERQAMNEVTRELKKLTTDYGITIFLLAQVNRAVENRENKQPLMADLKESGSLEQDANVVMLLSASSDNKEKIRCEIAKNREGMTGVAPFVFKQQFMDFSVDFDEWRG